MSKTPEFVVWANMIARCSNPNHIGYHNYGGRGIKVSDEFMDFAVFIEAIGRRPSPLLTVERVDNSRGYERGNVRWATRQEQGLNTRSNRIIEYNGQSNPLKVWAEIAGIDKDALRDRLNRGWPVNKALTTPSRARRKGELSSMLLSARR